MQLADFMIVDAVEHVGEPFFGINAVMFAGGEEGIEHSRALSSLMAARK